MSTIRERVARLPEGEGLAFDRRVLLDAGDALAEGAAQARSAVFRGKQLAATPGQRSDGGRWLGDALNRIDTALAAWKAATG